MKLLIAFLLSVAMSFGFAAPATPTDLEEIPENYVQPSVHVEALTPIEEARFGKEFSLMCVVEGLDGEDYFIQWQYSLDCEEWFNIDCHESVYTFILDRINNQYYHRVYIIYNDDE